MGGSKEDMEEVRAEEGGGQLGAATHGGHTVSLFFRLCGRGGEKSDKYDPTNSIYSRASLYRLSLRRGVHDFS